MEQTEGHADRNQCNVANLLKIAINYRPQKSLHSVGDTSIVKNLFQISFLGHFRSHSKVHIFHTIHHFNLIQETYRNHMD